MNFMINGFSNTTERKNNVDWPASIKKYSILNQKKTCKLLMLYKLIWKQNFQIFAAKTQKEARFFVKLMNLKTKPKRSETIMWASKLSKINKRCGVVRSPLMRSHQTHDTFLWFLYNAIVHFEARRYNGTTRECKFDFYCVTECVLVNVHQNRD